MPSRQISDIAIAAPLPLAGTRLRTRSGERALVRAAQRGSADAKETLVRRHWPDAHRVAFFILGDRTGAEDVAQESMLAAIGALDRFDSARPLRPWVHRIVVNRARDWIRARERRGEVGIEAEDAHSAVAHPHVRAAAEEGASTPLAQALNELDPTTRAMVVLRYLLDYRAREIGDMLGFAEGTVRTRLHRALAELRTRLADDTSRRAGLSNDVHTKKEER
jgi:RNA polymerase sigma factor (sigma-70 family)